MANYDGKFKQRIDTAANWTALNPVLLAGEMGVELGNPLKFKIGDGTTPWNSNPVYFLPGGGTTGGGTGDMTPPVVAITAPLPGAILAGATNPFTATATDNTNGSGLAKVRFYLDDVLLAEDTSSPFSANVDATALSAGNHRLKVIALDVAGNMSSAAERTITVAPAAAQIFNYALSSNGATATATSEFDTAHGAINAIAGRRTAPVNWSAGGIWHSLDAPSAGVPQVLEVTYSKIRAVTEFVVVGVRDSFTDISSVNSLPETVISYPLMNYRIDALISGTWTTVATVTGNARLMRRIPVAPHSTTKHRLIVTSSGTAARVSAFEAYNRASRSGKISRILMIGNSMTRHPFAPAVNYWWDDSGMAASTPAKDYVHLLRDLMQNGDSPGITYEAHYCAAWEMNFAGYDKSNFDSYFTTPPDTVLIRLGENVTWSSGYQAAFQALVEYVQSKAPLAQVIISGDYWTGHAATDADQQAIAAAKGLLYIPLVQLDTPANRSSESAVVSGADGVTHVISEAAGLASAVAAHPGDAGMRAMADEIYNQMYLPVGAPPSSTATAGGINAGGGGTNGIYQADSFAAGGATTSQNRTYSSATITNLPPKAVLDTVRYNLSDAGSFTETYSNFVANASYRFRVFTVWDGGAFTFDIKANEVVKGRTTCPAAAPGIVYVTEFDATADLNGAIVFRFVPIATLALINAIDWTPI